MDKTFKANHTIHRVIILRGVYLLQAHLYLKFILIK